MKKDPYKEICKNCGCTWGSHSASSYFSEHYRAHIQYNQCPGNEGRMDWDKSPGTVFAPTGMYKETK